MPSEDEANASVTSGRTESGLLVTKPVVAVTVLVAVAASGITSGAAETVIVYRA